MLVVVPGQPQRGLGHHVIGMVHQGLQVLERIHLAQLAGVDETHERVADRSPLLRLEEQRVPAMSNRFLQRAFTHIVVQRRTCLAQE